MASRCDLALCWAVARETAARNAAPATNSLRLIVITSSAVANSIADEGRPVREIGDYAATMGALWLASLHLAVARRTAGIGAFRPLPRVLEKVR